MTEMMRVLVLVDVIVTVMVELPEVKVLRYCVGRAVVALKTMTEDEKVDVDARTTSMALGSVRWYIRGCERGGLTSQ